MNIFDGLTVLTIMIGAGYVIPSFFMGDSSNTATVTTGGGKKGKTQTRKNRH